MKAFVFTAVAVLVSSQAMASAQPDRWSSAMGMDGQTMNYSVTDIKGNYIGIQCGKEPAVMHASINGHEYGPAGSRSNYAKGDFVMIVDGKTLMPSDAGSNAGGDNFRYAWDAIRAGKKIIIKGGKDTMVLPVLDAAKVLPTAQKSPCESW